ncbi:hypothetical protein GIB67_037389 [Kingdonia uniflora]|uniref:Nuclear pore complex protein n=1 Tax=Kingdonia uniflora TaxID=39325 RepID=A0A7J7M8G5_9MAGN|nr:hypothetical protein GIB67_037389 [Kingdonia uniflora]
MNLAFVLDEFQVGLVFILYMKTDRLEDIASTLPYAFFSKNCNSGDAQLSSGSEAELRNLRESIQHLLRWGWKYNKNLEEQAAQLHMLSGWAQMVEVSVSRRLSSVDNRLEILLDVLDASLSASASPDCSLKMAIILSQVALTCMAKLRDERFLSPGGLNGDSVTCLDVIMVKQLSNSACHSILFKLVMAILRHESSEALRRRQYALLLSYFQYCRHMLDPDVPAAVLHFLLQEEQKGEDDLDLQKIDKEQAELARTNFSILKKEAQAILDVVTKDAIQGSEAGKAVSLFILDAFISIDQERFFLNQLQSRGFLRSCLTDISNVSYKDGWPSLDSLQRVYVFEAKLALLLRISYNYGKPGSQVLFSMGTLEHLAACKMVGLQLKGAFRRNGKDLDADFDKQRLVICPVLRLVSSLTSLVDSSEFLEVNSLFV